MRPNSFADLCGRLITGVLILFFAVRCYQVFEFSIRSWRDPDSQWREIAPIRGLVPVAQWIRTNSCNVVYGESHDQYALLCERLSEMIYPAVYLPYSLAPASNAVVVTPLGHEPPGSWTRLYVQGDLQILGRPP